MPSILQQQLQQVSRTWGSSAGQRQRGKPSLLYTAQEAADVDLQTLFELAQEGEAMLAKSKLRGCWCLRHFACSGLNAIILER